MSEEGQAVWASTALGEGALDEFESRLSARTKVPAERLGEFLGWPEDKLRRETDVVGRVLKRFAEAVVASMESPAAAETFLRTLDLKSISRDHDWRAIFSTIRVQDADCVEYKRAVLIKYLQYLSFRRRLLEYIHSRRQGLEETDAYTEVTMFPRRAPEVAVDGDGRARVGEFERLPLGEAVEFDLPEGRRVDLVLSGHLFRLIGGRPPFVVDQNSVMYFLREGRNMVGRHPESDVAVDANFSTVSRAHLIIEWNGDARVTLMDVSSKGTFVRSEVIDAAHRAPAAD